MRQSVYLVLIGTGFRDLFLKILNMAREVFFGVN